MISAEKVTRSSHTSLGSHERNLTVCLENETTESNISSSRMAFQPIEDAADCKIPGTLVNNWAETDDLELNFSPEARNIAITGMFGTFDLPI